jgi:hypothetical protein
MLGTLRIILAVTFRLTMGAPTELSGNYLNSPNLMIVECPLLALSGHTAMTALRSLLGVKRTWLGHCQNDAIDPKRTWALVTLIDLAQRSAFF